MVAETIFRDDFLERKDDPNILKVRVVRLQEILWNATKTVI